MLLLFFIYLFYQSKEELFLDVVSNFKKESEGKILALLEELDENHIVTSLTKVFTYLTKEVCSKGIYRILDEKQQAIIRKKVLKLWKFRPWRIAIYHVQKMSSSFFIFRFIWTCCKKVHLLMYKNL